HRPDEEHPGRNPVKSRLGQFSTSSLHSHLRLRKSPRPCPSASFRAFLEGVRLSLAGGDQPPQVAAHERAPRCRAVAVALECGDEARMREANFRLVALLRDLEDDVRADPLVFPVEAELRVGHVPDDLLARNELCHFLPGEVRVPVAVGELGSYLVEAAADLSRPPPADVVYRIEDLFRRLVHRNARREVFGFHSCHASTPSETKVWMELAIGNTFCTRVSIDSRHFRS